MIRRSPRAFTLMETLLALALILLLFGAMYIFANQTAATRKRLESDSSRQRQLTDVFDAIERAALTSIAGDRALGAGVSGSGATLSIIDRAGPTLVRRTWKLDEPAGLLTAIFTPIRLESAESADAAPPEGWADGLALIRFRFLKSGTWSDAFDSLAAASLPDAIEVSAWFARDTDRSQPADATVSSPLQRGPDRRRLILLDPLAVGGST